MPAPFDVRGARGPWFGAALANLGLGWLVGAALAHTRVDAITDLTLRTAAAFAVVWPVVLLDRMTTPEHWPTRVWLGDTASAAVTQGVRQSFAWLVAGLMAPLGVSLHTDGLPWHGPAAAAVALAMVGVWLASVHALLGALRAIGRGQRIPDALAGGGTFGPADAAQLIYAPAQGFVVGMAPVVVLTAWWGARGLALPLPTWVLLVGLALGSGWLAGALVRSAGPQLYGGLRAVQVAHATRFATAQLLPALPPWLGFAAQAGAAGRWLGLAFSRHFPLSPIVLGALAVVVAAVGPLWPLDLAIVAAAIAYLGATRRLALRAQEAWTSARWMGVGAGALAAGERRIGATLAGLGCGCALAVVWSGSAESAAGALFGAAVGACLGIAATLSLGDVPRWVGWTRVAAWAICVLTLGPGSAR